MLGVQAVPWQEVIGSSAQITAVHTSLTDDDARHHHHHHYVDDQRPRNLLFQNDEEDSGHFFCLT